MKAKGYKNKTWTCKNGKQIIGTEFDLKQITKILKNLVYIGKIQHKDQIYQGEHQAIISHDLWEKVQVKLAKLSVTRTQNTQSERPKLVGKIYDYHGNRMVPTYSYKYSKNGRYKMRYYINREIKKYGESKSEFKRIRADYIDKIVAIELTKIIESRIVVITNSKNPELISANLKDLQDSKGEPLKFLSKAILFPDHIELYLRNGDIVNMPIQYKRFNGKLCISSTDKDTQYMHF